MYKEERKEEEDRDDVRAQALEELNRTGKQERLLYIVFSILKLPMNRDEHIIIKFMIIYDYHDNHPLIRE